MLSDLLKIIDLTELCFNNKHSKANNGGQRATIQIQRICNSLTISGIACAVEEHL
jgi:hypothetical protein